MQPAIDAIHHGGGKQIVVHIQQPLTAGMPARQHAPGDQLAIGFGETQGHVVTSEIGSAFVTAGAQPPMTELIDLLAQNHLAQAA